MFVPTRPYVELATCPGCNAAFSGEESKEMDKESVGRFLVDIVC